MPPEFINENKISVKNDIFSLGVVIMEIIWDLQATHNLKKCLLVKIMKNHLLIW